MDVTDLGATGAQSFSCGAFLALDQSGVGGEVLDSLEAVDIMDFVEDGHGEDFSSSRNGTKSVEIILVMELHLTRQVELKLSNERVVVAGELDVGSGESEKCSAMPWRLAR